MNKCLSKFVITRLYFMAAILMLIIIDSAYISDALAQTNATDIGTKRIIATQKTTASGENVTNVGNDIAQTSGSSTEPKRIIATQKTTASGENVTNVGNDIAQTSGSSTEPKRIIATQKTT